MATETVLMCVVQYLDGGDVRLSVAGWDGAGPEQRAPMRREAISSAGLDKFPDCIQSVRFVEIEMPIVEAIVAEEVVVRDVA